MSLIRGLPRTSRTGQSVHGPEWTRTDHLLAAILDQLAVANWQRAAKNAAQAKKPLPTFPTPIARPGLEAASPSGGITAEQLLAHRARHALEEAPND